MTTNEKTEIKPEESTDGDLDKIILHIEELEDDLGTGIQNDQKLSKLL